MAKEINKTKVVAYLGDSKLELATPLIVAGKEIKVTLIANKSGFTIDEIEDFPTHIYMKLQGLVEPFLR